MADKWYSRALSVFDRKPPVVKPSGVVATGERGVGGASARLSEDSRFGTYFSQAVSRSGVQTSYARLTEEVLNQLPASAVRDLIRSSNPTVSKALADYEDWIASGFTQTADRLMDSAVVGSPAQKVLDDFLMRMEREADGIDTVIRSMSRGMFSHGAAFTELVVGKDKRTPLLIKALDPTTAVFVRSFDKDIGEFYELGQDWSWDVPSARRAGRSASGGVVRRRPKSFVVGSRTGFLNFVSLHDDPTVQYRPVQPEPNYPYGIPLLDPAVFHVILAAGFFTLFEQALHGHVWPNLLINIDKEKFIEHHPESDPKRLELALNALAKDITETVGKLKPGGVMVYTDDVNVGDRLTGNQRNPLGSVKDIHDVIRRELVLAVKSQPILMASNESIAETHANLQLISYGQLIRKSKKMLNAMVTNYFNLILELNEFPPLAEFRLHYQNTAEYRDQSLTFEQFRSGLKTASEDLVLFVEALDEMKERGYIDEAQARSMFTEGMSLRAELNILPRDL